MKLDDRARHLLFLVQKGAKEDGWSRVSEMVWPLLKIIPSELIESRKEDDGGYAKLTEKGQTILDYT